jgi:two-component system, chemotaxis family, chemotaxis protein CheY
MRALIVDDSAAMRRIEQKAVESIGWQVTTAPGVAEAITALASGPFDLVITDWHMPEADGIDLVRHIRRDAALAGLKILMVTSEATHTAIADAIAAGVDELVMKPFSTDVLCERIADVMAGA